MAFAKGFFRKQRTGGFPPPMAPTTRPILAIDDFRPVKVEVQKGPRMFAGYNRVVTRAKKL